MPTFGAGSILSILVNHLLSDGLRSIVVRHTLSKNGFRKNGKSKSLKEIVSVSKESKVINNIQIKTKYFRSRILS
jgi:hypothetical protein